MTKGQRGALERLAAGQVVEIWWEAGGTRWWWRLNAEGTTPELDTVRPHHMTIHSLVARKWAKVRRYKGGAGLTTKIRHRLGYARQIWTYEITVKGRQVLTLAKARRV